MPTSVHSTSKRSASATTAHAASYPTPSNINFVNISTVPDSTLSSSTSQLPIILSVTLLFLIISLVGGVFWARKRNSWNAQKKMQMIQYEKDLIASIPYAPPPPNPFLDESFVDVQ